MNAPTLSVVIPAFDEEEIIGECLARLVAQRVHITEVVVVDNNSTDRTREIVAEYAARWSAIRLLTESEQGLVHARNRGLDSATGELLARIDADTLVPPHWAGHIVDFFAADADHDWAAACGRGQAYDLPYGDTVGALRQRWRARKADRVKAVPVLYGSNMILRASTWARVRDRVTMRRDIFEDVDTGLCVTETGGRNAFLPTITVGVAPRRMATGTASFARYMACLPRTLVLHRRYGLALAAATVYLPAIITLHAARLALLRLHNPGNGQFTPTEVWHKPSDRVAP
ncbi:glycosyltransferase family 2 protein [Nocardia caishijiensis]|uniref:4,4'-diaponeurosporenoate glycosyltransferase n=1 Tax=Nocardia caishijiensis TaxID=184756 RepID=A0ABQ6YIA4_9NOCA|nr:glycosyltransferase family 2 protein [Nocardia caishijiensis]KAF0845239.1 glycosyl transferase family 2 [Nocardia caishijiensis]